MFGRGTVRLFRIKRGYLEEVSRIDWTSDRARTHAAPVNAASCAHQVNLSPDEEGKRVSNEVLTAVSVHSLCT